MRIHFQSMVLFVFFLLIGSFAPNVRGETLETQMAEFARRVARACKRHDAQTIVVKFENPIYRSIRITDPKMAENASHVLQRLAIEELGKTAPPELKLASSPYALRGSTSVEGQDLNTNTALPDTTPALVVASIGGELHNEAGELLETIEPVEVSDPEQLVRLFGLSVSEQPDNQPTDSEGDSDNLPDQMIHPNRVAIDGTKVRATEDSSFAVQILVDGVALQPELVSGGALVELREDEVFVVQAFSDADYDVGTELYVDGIHSNHFRGSRFFRIIRPHGWTEFEGWRTSDERVNQFRITPFEQSVAAGLGVQSDVGLLQVTFRRTWPKNEEPPLGETKSRSLGVGQGAELEGRKLTKVERDFGDLKASVVIRYQRK